ncbi:hypothetical protein CUMW_157260, partial [Citrus unshiu]
VSGGHNSHLADKQLIQGHSKSIPRRLARERERESEKQKTGKTETGNWNEKRTKQREAFKLSGSLATIKVAISFNRKLKDLATVKVAISFSRKLKDLAERSACYHLLREWSFCFEKMDVNARSSHSNEKKSIDYSASANERNMSMEKNADTSVFVNHAELAWHENRRKWVGDQSQRPQRMDKDPIISWSTTYEELLLSNRPFPEPIPLPEF